MHDHPDVGNDPDEMSAIFLIYAASLVIACGKKDFGPGTLPFLLLVFIESFLQELVALRKYEFI